MFIRHRRRFHQCFTYLKNDVSAPLMVMYFSILFINTILRDTKDTMLVTLSEAGVEAIPFVKTYLVIPASMLFFLYYSKLSKRLSPRDVFRTILFTFCMFYILFTGFLFPNMTQNMSKFKQNQVNNDNSNESLVLKILYHEWPLALFFIISELWASCVCQLLFWQTANDALTVREAKKIYPLIGAFGNLGMVFGGQFLYMFANERDSLITTKAFLRIPHDNQPSQMEYWLHPFDKNPIIIGWIETLSGISLVLIITCILNIYLFDNILKRKNFGEKNLENESFSQIDNKTTKSKISLKESFYTLSNNEAIKTCAVLVVSYGISSCLVEVTWKAEVKRNYEGSSDYSRFMAKFWFYTGIVSMCFMVLGRYILPIKGYGYKISVLFTPIVEILAGSVFYFTSYFRIGNSAYVGAFLVMTAKSAKYAFFDTTKEMIFISLNPEAKSIGKAAIELICYRLSKSGGSFYLQLIILITDKVNSKKGLLLGFSLFIMVCFCWFIMANRAERYVKDGGYSALLL